MGKEKQLNAGLITGYVIIVALVVAAIFRISLIIWTNLP